MPSRARLDEFIAAVVSGDHAGAIERFYTEDASRWFIRSITKENSTRPTTAIAVNSATAIAAR